MGWRNQSETRLKAEGNHVEIKVLGINQVRTTSQIGYTLYVQHHALGMKGVAVIDQASE